NGKEPPMKPEPLSRRDLLLKCDAMGVLAAAPSLSLAEAIAAWQPAPTRKPTPWNEIGPFYKRAAPQNAHLRAAGDPGFPLSVSGAVLNTRGEVVKAAK